jgi:hypothetical protein
LEIVEALGLDVNVHVQDMHETIIQNVDAEQDRSKR